MNGEEKVDEKVGLWQSLLRDASHTNRDSSLLRSTVFLCGDDSVGKCSLLRAMMGSSEDDTEGGFGYSFYEYEDEKEHHVEAWWLSEKKHVGFLEQACPSDASELIRTAFAICLNLSEPEKIKSSLESWMSLIENVLTKKLDSLEAEAKDSIFESSRKRFSEYDSKEPKKDDFAGVPIVIVCTQSDSLMGAGERLNIRKLSWLQWWLRQYCLSRGIALICTSAKLGVNCDVLKRYLTHCAHKCGSKFEIAPQVTNLERLFIPIGADASQALSVLLQSSGMDADSNFETAMKCEEEKNNLEDVEKVSIDTKNHVSFASPSVFLESLKILSDAQEKTLKPRKIVVDAGYSASSTSKDETVKDTISNNATSNVPVADQKELSSFFQSLINTKTGSSGKKNKTAKKKPATRRSKRVMTRRRTQQKDG